MAIDWKSGVGWSVAQSIEHLASETEFALFSAFLTKTGSPLLGQGGNRFVDLEFQKAPVVPQGSVAPPEWTAGVLGSSLLIRFRNFCIGDGQNLPRLAAYGTPISSPSEYRRITPFEWRGITRFWLGLSQIGAENRPLFSNVSVFPVLLAPDAELELFGQTLWNVVRRHVLEDVQIIQPYLVIPPEKRPRLCDLFDKHRYFGVTASFAASSEEIDVLMSTMERLHPDEPVARSDIISKVYSSRLTALGRILADGRVTVLAIREGGGDEVEVLIPPAEFRKPSLRVCLASGDIWQEGVGEKRRLYQAVRFEKRAADLSQTICTNAEPEAVLGALEEKPEANKGGAPQDPDKRAAFDELLCREFNNVGHGFESGAAVARDVTQILIRHQKHNFSDAELRDEHAKMERWIKRNYPRLWDMFKGGPKDVG